MREWYVIESGGKKQVISDTVMTEVSPSPGVRLRRMLRKTRRHPTLGLSGHHPVPTFIGA